MDGDILYAEIEGADKYLMDVGVTVDSHTLHPLLKYYEIDRDDMDSIKQKIVF